MVTEYLVIVSDADPVAVAVAERWGTLPAVGDHVDGVAVRRLGPHAELLRRPVPHIHDERVDERLPVRFREGGTSIVFPSVHRSRENVECLTVHPLGNPGPEARLGGQPRRVNPTDARRMACALRQMAESAPAIGVRATYEATHHGPALDLPSFFIEIGFGAQPGPSPETVRVVAETIANLEESPVDRVALAVGGGHYAPHFTELALERRWAFGHIVSRHSMDDVDREGARTILARTAGASGVVYARAADAERSPWAGLVGRLRDGDAPSRRTEEVTPSGRSTSGT